MSACLNEGHARRRGEVGQITPGIEVYGRLNEGHARRRGEVGALTTGKSDILTEPQ